MASPKRSRARAADALWDEPRPATLWPDAVAAPVRALRDMLAAWLSAEVAPGRLMPWLAIAFGFGIVLYFAAWREPMLMATLGLCAAGIIAAALARRRSVAFPLTLGCAAIAAGFAVPTLKTALIDHPVLTAPMFGASVQGFVEVREERARSDRIVVRVHRIEGARQALERVRVSVRKGTAPPVGAFVAFKARLTPPLPPLRPGGYDFARDMFFQRLGASGFVLGKVTLAEPPAAPDWRLRLTTAIDGLRDGMDNRIRAVLPGDRGAIASALITGKRDTISEAVNEAMYVSSLAHVLSISGYHMAVVAGIVFFVIRALLALLPGASGRYPIKKWSALAALAAATFYLVLSGAEVATQRSYIMVAIVLIGVMADRPALTLRTLTVAAFAVLLVTPEAVVHPSFQMSFAATLALVAGYQSGLPWRAHHDSSLGTKAAMWGARELTGLVLASVVAGLATTLYAAYHFHRLAPYGVLSNLAAMPVVSGFVMPMGILGAVTMPFGYDDIFWRAMGIGLDWMTGVALWVSSLPGAVGHIHAFGIGPLLLGTLGLLLICLLRTPLRWSGALLAAVAAALAVATPQPDILIAADAKALAVRGDDGRLAVARTGSDSFAVRDWLAADGDPRRVTDPALAGRARCDPIGCILRLPDGRAVALAQTLEALAEDCRAAAVVVSPREAQTACAARLIDRAVWRHVGATALFASGDGFRMIVARPEGSSRPWASRQDPPTPTAAPGSSSNMRPPAPDATPRAEDLEAGD
ncbi:MAG TPA: ComEC/Rec2 family competence protein [Pseudolabrys sp.]|nr:ComEC/Rec2 family competence protein [Pseudolabrys sp.]